MTPKAKPEIRMAKSKTNFATKNLNQKIQNTESERSLFWNFTYFGYLRMFRISDFELRNLFLLSIAFRFSNQYFPRLVSFPNVSHKAAD